MAKVDVLRIGFWGIFLGDIHVFGATIKRPETKYLISQLTFAEGKEMVNGIISAEEKQVFIATL